MRRAYSVKNEWFESVLVYFTIFIYILNSGSVYRKSTRALPWMLFMFLLSVLVFLKKNKWSIPHDFRIYYLAIIVTLLFVHRMLFTANGEIYFGLIFTLTSAYLIGISIRYENISSAYINILVCLALPSFIVWFLDTLNILPLRTFQILPDLVVYSNQSSAYHNFLFTTVNQETMALYDHPRNASIFWEPGLFQAFLNIALAMNISKSRKILSLKTIILLLALFSTFSTTGYLTFVVILVGYMMNIKKWKKSNIPGLVNIPIITILLALVFIISTSTVVSEKFAANRSTNRSFIIRISDIAVDIQTFINNPLLGCGAGNIDYKLNPLAGCGSSGWTRTLAQFGILLGILFLLPYYLFKEKYSNILWAIAITSLLMTEDIAFMPAFVLLFFLDKSGLCKYRFSFKHHAEIARNS